MGVFKLGFSGGLGAGIFFFWIFMSLIFGAVGLVITYFVIKFAVKNAIRDSEVDLRFAIKKGIIDAHKEIETK